ncbi:MAG: hypothetical protein LBL70_05685 [Treponema sp.]|jgi:hypothetical protein|nr:hypothetical protein [Treponema sp.]
MDNLSQSELKKILSLKTKPDRQAGSGASGPDPRFRRFAGLYSKDIAADPACSLTQDEVDRALAGSGDDRSSRKK